MKVQQIHGPWGGRPFKKNPIGVVVHAMAEKIKGLHAPEFLRSVGLSVHACIAPDGTVLKCAPETQTAYHAGKSHWQGIDGLNSCFLGVELLVAGEHDYDSFIKQINNGKYTDAQYKALAQLVKEWKEKFGWVDEVVVGHSDVSGEDVRPGDAKQDPGKAFEWSRFWNEYDKV